MQWIRSVFRSTRRLAGTDLEGNKYYEIIREGRKPRREVVPNKKLKHEQYTHGAIPVEWEAWLRGSIKDPPSHDDLIRKERQQLVLAQKVQEVNLRDKQRQEREYAEGLVSRPLGHASSQPYGYNKESREPQTTGKLFKPGVWDKQMEARTNEDDKDERYEPEAWKPP